MGERSEGAIQRVLKKVEDRVEEWREKDSARKTQAEAGREQSWQEAAERERLLAEEMREEESREDSPMGASGQRQSVAYVVHSKEMGRTIKEFANGRQRLVDVMPGKGDYSAEADVEGSWLVFEEDE